MLKRISRKFQKENDIHNDKKMFFKGKIVLCISIVVIIGIALTYFFNNYSNFITNILTIKQRDGDYYINTIFQVHGGITVLTISILALITGLNKEKIYGIKTVEFMAIRNNFILNFYDEIVLSLILLLLQCVFVAFAAMAAVVFIFLVSISVIIHMLYCCIKVTFFSEKVEMEIREFIVDEFKKSLKQENSKSESKVD